MSTDDQLAEVLINWGVDPDHADDAAHAFLAADTKRARLEAAVARVQALCIDPVSDGVRDPFVYVDDLRAALAQPEPAEEGNHQ